MSEVGSMRTAVESCMMEGMDDTECSFGWSTSNLLGATDLQPDGLSATIDLEANTASLVATFGGKAAAVLVGETASQLGWYRDTSGNWTCGSSADAKFRPAGCSVDLATAEGDGGDDEGNEPAEPQEPADP
ncbi:pilin [Microbulbifer bruguierae]